MFHKSTVFGFLLILLTAIPGFADHDASITKSFSAGFELTDDEIKTILQLARTAGIEQVAEIHTGCVHPSSDGFVSLKEKETRQDGKVSYRRLFVCKREWTRRPSKHDKTKSSVAISGFWVDRVFREELVIVQIRGTEHRIDLRDRISVPKAQDIITAFLDKKFILSKSISEKDKENIQRIDFSQPTYLAFVDATDTMRIGFKSKSDPLEGFSVRFVLENDQIRVVQVFSIIA